MGGSDKEGRASVEVRPIQTDFETSEQQSSRKSSTSASWTIQDWTPTALLCSYFVFSIALYTILDDDDRKVFWFLYLTIATLVAASTALEAYDGLTPLREARKALKKASESDFKFTTKEEELPYLHLIFDLADSVPTGDLSDVLDGLLYPQEKVAVSFLRIGPIAQRAPIIDYVGYDEPSSVRILTLPGSLATSLSARVAYCLSLDVPKAPAAITAVFRSNERLHPHAARLAAERFIENKKVEVVQGRTILVSQESKPGIISILSSIHQDSMNALLQPGRSLTWDLKLPNETNTYWRLDTLRAVVSASASITEDGFDLGFTALGRLSNVVFDLGIIAFAPGPKTTLDYLRALILNGRHQALATIRYTKLAYSRYRSIEGDDKKPSIKRRVSMRCLSNIQSRTPSFSTLVWLSQSSLSILLTPRRTWPTQSIFHTRFPSGLSS
jgi:hypothetical protein